MTLATGLPPGPFSTIVMDPPWPYDDRLPGGGRGAAKHYSLMTLDEIAAMPIGDMAAPDAHVYVWATNGFVAEAVRLIGEWGFTYKTLLTWVKVNKAGNPHIGMGHYFRNVTEHVAFGVRGRLPTASRSLPTVFYAPRTRHSEKPGQFYDMVRTASPGPRIDLFARRGIDGFSSWGNEIDPETTAQA